MQHIAVAIIILVVVINSSKALHVLWRGCMDDVERERDKDKEGKEKSPPCKERKKSGSYLASPNINPHVYVLSSSIYHRRSRYLGTLLNVLNNIPRYLRRQLSLRKQRFVL